MPIDDIPRRTGWVMALAVPRLRVGAPPLPPSAHGERHYPAALRAAPIRRVSA